MNESSIINFEETTKRKILSTQSSNDSVLIQKKWFCLSDKWISILFCFVASLGYVWSGTLIAWNLKATWAPLNRLLDGENADKYRTSTVLATIPPFGAGITSLLVYKNYYSIGTKWYILVSASLMISSSYLTYFGTLFTEVVVGRVLGGVAVGTIFTVVPHYIDELASKRYKNLLDSILYVQFAAGVLVYHVADFIGNTQIVGVVVSSFPIFLFIGFLFMPDSPRYLCAKERINRARQILRITNRDNAQQIENQINRWQDRENISVTYQDAITGRQNIRALFPIFGLIVLQQLIGAIPIIFYYNKFFSLTSGTFCPELKTIFVASIMVLSIPINRVFCFKIKDRTLLKWTSMVMAICMALLGWDCHRGRVGLHPADQGSVPLVCFGIYIFCFTIGFYRLPDRMMEKLVVEKNYFASRSLVTAFSWILIGIFVRIMPYLIKIIGVGWIFWNITMACIFAVFFIIVFVPDLQAQHFKSTTNSSSTTTSSDETLLEV